MCFRPYEESMSTEQELVDQITALESQIKAAKQADIPEEEWYPIMQKMLDKIYHLARVLGIESWENVYEVFVDTEYSNHGPILDKIKTIVAKKKDGSLGEMEALEALEEYPAMGFILCGKDPHGTSRMLLAFHHVIRRKDEGGNDTWYAIRGVPEDGFRRVCVIKVDTSWFWRTHHPGNTFLVPPAVVVSLCTEEAALNVRTIMEGLFDENVEEEKQVLDAWAEYVFANVFDHGMDTIGEGVSEEEMCNSAVADNDLVENIRNKCREVAVVDAVMERAVFRLREVLREVLLGREDEETGEVD